MSVPSAVAFIGILVGTLQARFSSPSATWTVTSVVPSAARASLGFPPAIRAIAATAASVTPTRKLLRCRCPPPFRGSVHSILLFSGMDNFTHKAHKLKSHEKLGYTKSPPPTHSIVPLLAPFLDTTDGAFLFASVDTAGREASSGDRYIGVRSDSPDNFVPCVGRQYSLRPVRLFRTSCPIRGHFHAVSGH